MESNNLDRAEDTERKLRELSERPKDWIEDIEKKLQKLTESTTRTNAKKVKVGVRGKKIIVEQLDGISFRVRSDVIDVRRGDIIVLPSGEEREVIMAIADPNRRFGEPFYIYFTTTER